MRIFNRIIVLLILIALFVASVYGAVYSFGLLGNSLQDLPSTLGLTNAYQSVQSFISDIEGGSLQTLAIAILIGVAILGLILLILELKPRRPRLVQIDRNAYVTRSSVQGEVNRAAEDISEVLESSSKVKARRRPGAKVKLNASVRRGENVRELSSSIRDRVSQKLSDRGVPVSSMKLDLKQTDPQGTRARVK